MTLAARLALGFLLLVVLMAALAAHLLLTIRDFHRGQADLVALHIEAVDRRADLRRDLESIREFTRKLFALSDPDYARALSELRSEVRSGLEELVRAERAPGVRSAIGRFAELWGSYVEAAEGLEPRVVEASRPISPSELIEGIDELEAALDDVDAAARSAAQDHVEATAEEARRARRVAGLATAVAIGAALLVSFAISRSVLGPIRGLARGVEQVAEGNFTHHVPEEGGPELSALAREFNAMALRLAELDDLKREFVSSVSHDLKAPLASMQETSRLLLDGTVGSPSESQRKMLQLQLECGERLSAMIENLLAWARLEAGVAYDVESVDLTDLVASVAREALALIEAKDLTFWQAGDASGLVVRGDRSHLSRAVWNLLSNAVRFTPEGGEIGVRVERREGVAALSVWDSGPGVPDEDKERIFGRFERGRISGGPPGTGLGLAIARRVARDHGGRLRVEDHPGGGAVFELTLPLGGSRRDAA